MTPQDTMRATPIDLADDATAHAVHAIAQRAYRVESDLAGFPIPTLRDTVDDTRALPLRWLGCHHDDTLVAFIAWTEHPVDIDRLCVDPAWFRRGLATTLLRALLDRTTGDVTVATAAANTPAIALYERAGFTRTDTIEPEPGIRVATFALQRR